MARAHQKGSRRRPTNVSLRVDLVKRARALDLNLSHELETRIEEVIRQREAEAWKKENQGAIDDYARYLEKYGIWNEDDRGW